MYQMIINSLALSAPVFAVLALRANNRARQMESHAVYLHEKLMQERRAAAARIHLPGAQ
jgi:hypothetical protein